MTNLAHVNRMRDARGPRYLVAGCIRPGEWRAEYTVTPETAEQMAEEWRGEDWNYHQVSVTPPEEVTVAHTDGLRDLGRRTAEARAVEQDLRQQLMAATIAAIRAGMTESGAAELARVDRMTVRNWLGKR